MRINKGHDPGVYNYLTSYNTFLGVYRRVQYVSLYLSQFYSVGVFFLPNDSCSKLRFAP